MSTRFCPECGATCGEHDIDCHECRFPLALTVDVGSGMVLIGKDQLKTWGRIVQLLKRSGIRVQSRENDWTTHRYWWSLPIFGFVLFLATLLFGPGMVDSVWTPPRTAPAQILDLAKAKEVEARMETDDAETHALMEALRSSPDQVALTERLNTDHTKEVVRVEAGEDRILRYARQAMAVLTIRDFTCRGTVINGNGEILAPRQILSGAFERETKTVIKNGAMTQETILIQPMVQQEDGEPQPCRRLDEEPKTGLVLLGAAGAYHTEFKLESEFDLDNGAEVFVADSRRGSVSIKRESVIGSFATDEGILVWELSGQYQDHDSGSPVFDLYGGLVGILMKIGDGFGVYSLQRLSEKTPQFYKDIR